MRRLYGSDSDFDLVANLTALILLFAVERPEAGGWAGRRGTDWAHCVSAIKSSVLGEAGQDSRSLFRKGQLHFSLSAWPAEGAGSISEGSPGRAFHFTAEIVKCGELSMKYARAASLKLCPSE